jgi:glutamate synthase (NADPH/NADH) large chain
MVFMPKDDALRERCRAAFESTLAASGMKLLGWRKVPTRNDEIGHTAKMAEVRGPCHWCTRA